MAGDKKISELNELLADSVTDNDSFVMVNAGETKKIKKSSIFSLIRDLIETYTNAFVNSFGVIVVIAMEELSNTISTTYEKVKMVDTVQENRSNSHMNYSFANDNVEILSDGLYQFNIFGGVYIPQNIKVSFSWFVNDALVAVSAPVEFIGTANTAVRLAGALLISLEVGDMLDIRAKSDSDNTDITILATQFSIEKTHHK